MIQLRMLLKICKPLKHARHVSSSIAELQQVKELVKQVDPYSKIRIRCNCNIKIVPYDTLECPDSNLLKATFSNTDSHGLNVQVNGKEVSIESEHFGTTTLSDCILEIPIKADLDIRNDGSTSIADLYSDHIRVETVSGDIGTKSIRSTSVDLKSVDGNISCRGTTLAQTIRVVATGKGDILLDKLQGGEVDAESNQGNICVNSSYANNSSFETQQGDLLLKSIHKVCRVVSGGSGKFVMNGFYGTLLAQVACREISLQLSETVGKCIVQAPSAENMSLAISDTVHDNTEITIKCGQCEVDSSLAGDRQSQLNESGHIRLGTESTENKLHVEAGGGLVTLKKMSWADTFGFGMKISNHPILRYHIYYSGDERAEHGVGFEVLGKQQTRVIRWKSISDRISVLRSKNKFFNYSYAPKNEKPDDVNDEFYERLDKAHGDCQDLIVNGDANAQVWNESFICSIIGIESLHTSANVPE